MNDAASLIQSIHRRSVPGDLSPRRPALSVTACLATPP